MRSPEIITQEIQHLDKVNLSVKELFIKFPGDNLLSLSIAQNTARKNALIIELNESLLYHRRHSLQYIFTEVKGKIILENLLDGLNSFKHLLDKIYETVTAGKKNHLPIYFNTVFEGSYAIQLSTTFEPALVYNEMESTIGSTLSIIDSLVKADEPELKELLNTVFGDDRSLLSKYSLFFKKIHQTKKSVKIVWGSPISNAETIVEIDPDKAKLLHSFFSRKEKSEETVEYLGILKGLSLLRFKVEFVKDSEGKDVVVAKFNENMSEEVIDLIDTYVYAKFKVSVQFNEAKEEEERSYELIAITKQG